MLALPSATPWLWAALYGAWGPVHYLGSDCLGILL